MDVSFIDPALLMPLMLFLPERWPVLWTPL